MTASPASNTERVSALLRQSTGGNREALDQITPIVFGELHAMALSFLRKERTDHSLQATTLISEAFLKLVDQNRVQWKSHESLVPYWSLQSEPQIEQLSSETSAFDAQDVA